MRWSLALASLLWVPSCWAQAMLCIDPGHPSEVGPGTKGKFIREVDAVWLVGQELDRQLKLKGYRTVLTKSSAGQKVTNPKRAQIANRAKADLMVRLHCDHAVGDSGIATFYAAQPGRIGTVRGPSASVLRRVKAMALPFHKAMVQSLKGKLKDRGLRTDRQTAVGARYGALVGSIHSEVPSILVELCVLSNRKDEAFIRSASGRRQLAQALVAGIEAALQARADKR